jgi:p-aminobenzoyl-glutamate transporter AbgT
MPGPMGSPARYQPTSNNSSVLPLAPVSPFVPLFLGFLQRYRPDARLGTYYSLEMSPVRSK